MNRISLTILITSSVILSACTFGQKNSSPAEEQLVPEVATTLPEVPAQPGVDSQSIPPAIQSPTTITLDDDGKTITFRVGDSFHLDLGADVYDWSVTIDNQDVIALRAGTQSLYDALSSGTALLTATGNPKCLQFNPPCKIPTILFKVTLIVE